MLAPRVALARAGAALQPWESVAEGAPAASQTQAAQAVAEQVPEGAALEAALQRRKSCA